MPTATKRELDRLQPTTIVVLGGTGTVSSAAASRVVCAPPAAPAPTTPTAPTQPTAPAPPARPADIDCPDFSTQAAAQAFYDRYFPFYGDFARLDGSDNDGVVCESLP